MLLADDHPGFLGTARSLLNLEVDVVGCVDNGESLFEAGVRLRPDVIVTDISMPKLSGIQAANRLREAGCASKVLFLTVHTDPEIVRTALETGALGYVLKMSMATDLLVAIHEALAGRTFISVEAAE